MRSLSITVSPGGITNLEQALVGIANGAARALESAINETLRWAKTHLTQTMHEVQPTLSLANIEEVISIDQVAADGSLTGVLSLSYKREPLADFHAAFRKGSGVTVTTVAEMGPHHFKRMFRGSLGIGEIVERDIEAAKRVPMIGRYAGRTINRGPRRGQPVLRQPLRVAYGTPVLTAFENTPGVMETSVQQIRDYFDDRVAANVDLLLGKTV